MNRAQGFVCAALAACVLLVVSGLSHAGDLDAGVNTADASVSPDAGDAGAMPNASADAGTVQTASLDASAPIVTDAGAMDATVPDLVATDVTVPTREATVLDGGTATRAPAITESSVEQQVTVIGSSMRNIPGSASLIRREDLQNLAPQHAGEALRTVPGVNVVSEDGMGLRLNIGIRGLDPNRSRKVLVLEDGMPVSLNPYGSPELYYTPPIERMDRVEVVRGSGQILWGPQTVGGVINYITRDPPRRPSASADVRVGNYGYFLAQADVGATHGPVGWKFEIMHRRFNGPRGLDLALTDVTGRLRVEFSPRSVLRVKINFYDESSRATYVGPTTPQFMFDPTSSTAIHDRFSVQRYALGLMHSHEFSESVRLQTNVYAYQTNRAWRRQEFDRTDTGAEYERVCDPMGRCGAPGDPNVMPTNDRGSLYYRNSSAIRDRAFNVAGIESRLTVKWSAPKVVTGEFVGLVRFHRETAREQILITSFPTAEYGDPLNAEVRGGLAIAAAVQNRFTFWRKLHITPGIRTENFWSDRRITREPFSSMGSTVGRDVNVFGQAFSWALIPGVGVAWDVAQPVTLYTGVHRGYAPPRTRDAVSVTGENLRLDPELSWNTELGARVKFGRWLTADVAGFWLEFENQIIPPSEAGGTVSGGMYNTGYSRHVGLESSATFDIAPLLKTSRFALPLSVSYTWVPVAAFVGGLFDGNRLPYAPDHLLNVRLRFAHESGVSAQATMNYLGVQYADKENTPFPSADGLVGEIPGQLTLDLRVAYTWKRTGLTFSVNGRNLTNQVVVANRAPQGIQPTGYLQVFGGVEWTLPNP